MKKYLALLGVVLIVSSGIWTLSLGPRWTARFPDGWRWEANFLGTNLYPDPKTNQFPERKFPDDDDIGATERVVTVSAEKSPSGGVVLSDHYLSRDVNTGAVTWELTYKANIDPVTGLYLDKQYQGDYFIFPRNVEKKTYKIRNTSYQGLPLDFKGESTIESLSAYEFVYIGTMDNAAAYPDTKLEAGQGIRCTNMELRYWVEPLTGEVLKYRERCNADEVYEVATGKALYPLSRWSGESTGDDVIRRLHSIQAQRTTYLWVSSYIPLLLMVIGLLLIGISAVVFLVNRRPLRQVTP